MSMPANRTWLPVWHQYARGCVIFRIPLAVNNKDVVTKP